MTPSGNFKADFQQFIDSTAQLIVDCRQLGNSLGRRFLLLAPQVLLTGQILLQIVDGSSQIVDLAIFGLQLFVFRGRQGLQISVRLVVGFGVLFDLLSAIRLKC